MAAQVKALQDWAEVKGVEVQVFTEQVSGKTLRNRRVLRGILDALDAEGGKLVVTNLSRLTRSIADATMILERSNKKGWDLAVLDMGGETLDTTSATGRFMLRMLVEVMQWEREIIGERIRFALAEVKANGKQLGTPSSVPACTKRRIAALRRTMTWRGVAEELNTEGVPTPSGRGQWSITKVRRHHPARAE
jgi:DNA invertase Pin-like site-specific DNA recombinase